MSKELQKHLIQKAVRKRFDKLFTSLSEREQQFLAAHKPVARVRKVA